MTFNKTFFLLCAICTETLWASDISDHATQLSPILRPGLFRSEFLSHGTLRVLGNYSKQAGYDSFGFPVFKKAVFVRELAFYETKLAQTQSYANCLNRAFREEILRHPKRFSADTIAAYRQGDFSRNPIAADGTELRWHHDGQHRYILVRQTEHARPHTGGNKIWGAKYAEASSKLPYREMALTAQRWGAFSAIELGFSTINMMYEGKHSAADYAMNSLASVTAGSLAWGIESLLITSFPLLQGSTPVFIGGMMFNLGGPASWIATGTFILTKYLIMSSWKQHQRQVAMLIEERCKQREKLERVKILKRELRNNTAKLESLLQSQSERELSFSK